MTSEQITKIQTYIGDTLEETWKPTSFTQPKETYIDVFNYWEFRASVQGCGLEFLRPLNKSCVSNKFIFKHERLASYYYTSYCRIACMHQCVLDINKLLTIKDPSHLNPYRVIDLFEIFYLLFGSVLDNIGGVGNIVFNNPKDEDSFSNFEGCFIKDPTMIEKYGSTFDLINEVKKVKESFRTQIAHRNRLGTLWREESGLFIPYVQSKPDIGKAMSTITWRKELREMKEGRKESKPISELCKEHLQVLEKLVDNIFGICITNTQKYFEHHHIRLATDPTQFEIDLSEIPKEARWILYRCNNEKGLYLNMWFQDFAKDGLPNQCINSDCKSDNITPMYYVNDEINQD